MYILQMKAAYDNNLFSFIVNFFLPFYPWEDTHAGWVRDYWKHTHSGKKCLQAPIQPSRALKHPPYRESRLFNIWLKTDPSPSHFNPHIWVKLWVSRPPPPGGNTYPPHHPHPHPLLASKNCGQPSGFLKSERDSCPGRTRSLEPSAYIMPVLIKVHISFMKT